MKHMKTARHRFACVIAVASLIFGAAACAATDDNDADSVPNPVGDTASKAGSEDREDIAAAAQSIDEVDLSQPPPEDLWSSDEKVEKNKDCCVFKHWDGTTCRCETVTGTPAGTWFECQFKGASTKRGSACSAYPDCQNPDPYCLSP